MPEEIFSFAGQVVHLRRKRIKNMYLRVQRPDGHIEISAPLSMERAQIESFLQKNSAWVQKKQQVGNPPSGNNGSGESRARELYLNHLKQQGIKVEDAGKE